MELPAFIIPLIFFLFSGKTNQPVYLVFLGIWQLHYIQRTFVYPALLNKSSHKVPQKGLFKYVCSPHYFGEILEWGGCLPAYTLTTKMSLPAKRICSDVYCLFLLKSKISRYPVFKLYKSR